MISMTDLVSFLNVEMNLLVILTAGQQRNYN